LPSFFVEREGAKAVILGDDARHLARSLRARVGETIDVVDPAGLMLTVRLEQVSAERVEGTVLSEREHRPEPSARIVVAIANLRLPRDPGGSQRRSRIQAGAVADHLPRGGHARRPASRPGG
jgi:hypothetical protein